VYESGQAHPSVGLSALQLTDSRRGPDRRHAYSPRDGPRPLGDDKIGNDHGLLGLIRRPRPPKHRMGSFLHDSDPTSSGRIRTRRHTDATRPSTEPAPPAGAARAARLPRSGQGGRSLGQKPVKPLVAPSLRAASTPASATPARAPRRTYVAAIAVSRESDVAVTPWARRRRVPRAAPRVIAFTA
jgi:hypothetical protein